MSTASASSLVFPSLSHPKAINSFNGKSNSLSFLSRFSTSRKPTSLFLRFQQQQLQQPFPSRFLRHVAISSEFGQEEDVSTDGDELSFSPDLKLFVGNLPFHVDSAQLAGLFEAAGNVEMVEVIYDKVTGRSRGFGFVTMSTTEEVEAAIRQFNDYELDGRPLRVNSGPPPQRESGPRGGRTFDSENRVYVGNLSWNVDKLALETLFGEKGRVMDARVVYDRDSGRSRGFGFVTYSSAAEVDNAIDSLNGAELDGREIRVSVAEARPRRQF